MKNLVSQLPTYLLGFIYVVFGLNFFLHFIPMPPMEGNPATFIGLLASSGWMVVVKVLEIVNGGMLLANFKRPLAAVLLMPISICILLFEVLIAGAPSIGVLLILLNAYLLYLHKDRYMDIIR
jgi:putative oxidoreductase